MKTFPIFILLISLLVCFSCGKRKFEIKEYSNDQYKPEQQLHFSSDSSLTSDTMSNYYHLESIAYREKDSIKVIQLARNDAKNGHYFFMRFGLIALPDMDENLYNKKLSDQKKLCSRYNIWIYDMGCEDSEMGRIYTREMKRLLKQNKGLDFDSLFDPPLATL